MAEFTEAFNDEKGSFTSYAERFDAFVAENDIPEERQGTLFLDAVGTETFKLLSNLCYPNNPKSMAYVELKTALLKYYDVAPIEINERLKYWNAYQRDRESIADFTIRLKELASTCNFGSFLEEALRDNLVCGLNRKMLRMQRHLLTVRDLSLQDVEEKCIAEETALKAQRDSAAAKNADNRQQNSRQDKEKSSSGFSKASCKSCGEANHTSEFCRHKNSSCHSCKKRGHIQAVCSAGELAGPTQQKLSKISKQKYDCFLVLDFEANCLKDEQIEPQEIIEFPVLKINAETFEEEARFHCFVKPVHHPQLSDFCKSLTTITQEEVDNGKEFREVLSDFEKWIENDVGKNTRFMFVTCGDWDLRSMLPNQCKTSELQVPQYCRSWVNIKKSYSKFANYQVKGMFDMLKGLKLQHVGVHHRGLDDCINIANVLRALAERGFVFEATMKNFNSPL